MEALVREQNQTLPSLIQFRRVESRSSDTFVELKCFLKRRGNFRIFNFQFSSNYAGFCRVSAST